VVYIFVFFTLFAFGGPPPPHPLYLSMQICLHMFIGFDCKSVRVLAKCGFCEFIILTVNLSAQETRMCWYLYCEFVSTELVDWWVWRI